MSEHTWLGHRCGVATTEAELAACLAVLEEVRIQELRRGTEGSSLDSHAFGGADVDSNLLYVRAADGDEIVGCLRLTPATALAHVESSRHEYCLGVVPDEHVPRLLILTRLAVLPEHRGSPAALAIMAEMLSFGLDNGFIGSLMTCEPGLLGLYVALGARPIGPARRSPTGGFRVPMICIADADELDEVGSPLADVTRSLPGWQQAKPLQGWYDHFVAETGGIETGVRPFDPVHDGQVHKALTAGMSSAGVEALIKNAQVVGCSEGDRIVATDDGSTSVGLVASGLVEINRDGQSLALFGEGEVFGEMAFVRGAPRSADVIALTDETEVVLLSRKAIDRIDDPHDQVAVWQNLAVCVAERLAARAGGI